MAHELTQVDVMLIWAVAVEDVDAADAALESMPERFRECCFLEEDGEWHIDFSFETRASNLHDAALAVVADTRQSAEAHRMPGSASLIYAYADGFYCTWNVDNAGNLVATAN
jgi:hypothetical protein